MPTIKNAELIISTDRPSDRASVVVSCDVEFTEVEVNAMDVLGLRYTLSCRVLNQYLLDEDPVVTYGARHYPRQDEMARRYEHAVFEANVDMDSMHERLFGKDKLVAELTLRNDETRAENVARTNETAVDLAA
ncbi:MAG TPA: hypothetical protein VFG86_11280 [Chloroflexota bacterium]|jgi:hypothetical protein|nr:hypothetical protein [Chloroflexota bacterium]